MDEQRFDQLSRRFAGFRTRRQAVKAIAGAVVATVAGAKGAAAQSCTAHYSPCQGDGECCGGSVCEYGMCMPGCRIDSVFYSAWMSPPENICGQCLPEVSTTSLAPVNEGMSCWSGDPNAGVTTCQNGACAPVAPQSCPPPTPCHLEGEVDPVTGMCVNPPAPEGTLCGNSAMCYGDFYTPADTCDGNGFCIGGGAQTRSCAPYKCGEGDCTGACESDDDCAGGAHCDAGECFPDEDLGQPCDEDGDCQSGLCVEGVCCNQRCAGQCETCSAETGGYCSPVICDDGLSCTSGACDAETGQCSHTINPGTCLIEGACYADGAPNPADGCQACDPDFDQEGWSIRACAGGGVCYNGACVTSISGELTTGDAQGVCDCGSCYGDTYTITHGGGPLLIGLRGSSGGGGTLSDPWVDIHSTFDGTCNGNLSSDDDSGCDLDSLLNTNLAAGTYVVVATSFGGNATGSYTLTFGQGAAC